MYILNLSEPVATLGVLMVTVLFIILGREFKKSLIPAISLFLFLTLLLIHTYQSTVLLEVVYKSMVRISMCVDACMVLLSYISYLWIDDIETKAKNKKSIDNSLEWFWKKI